ncbi:hypothetical protein [Sulfurimonas paralvinellae]|uniref:DUF2846 domain-containing protein n=1 Tax=Sulfurimonas paralvinellae TaxID=317658 RepID=A0A7M1B9V7_9BACT|nr:hypothetical protein [Sulfurimonas paralvinellae]QOP46445.1 hypothetical protein FM071_09125 [Sulfurimonas paralvinellae]
MKKIYLLIAAMMSLFFVSCSNVEVGFEEESIFYQGGVVYIYLDKDMDSNEKYEVYINGEDTEISLMPGYKTRFGIKPGTTTIEIHHGNEKAAVTMQLKSSKNYYLRVQKDSHGKMEIIHIIQESIGDNVKNTPLYVDEKDEKPGATQKVEKKSEPQNKEGETTFYYDPLEGE